MNGDRERLHALVVEQEHHEAGQPEEGDGGADDAGQTAPGTPSASPASDSEQAQDNLDRMLETGEENPIS